MKIKKLSKCLIITLCLSLLFGTSALANNYSFYSSTIDGYVCSLNEGNIISEIINFFN